MAAVAARSLLIGALLSSATPVNISERTEFLDGLSRDELECLAEFHGACAIEAIHGSKVNPYALLLKFFGEAAADRWPDRDDRAHKACVVLTWLKFLDSRSVPAISPPAAAR